MLDSTAQLFIAAAFFVAALLKGITGLGFSTIALGFLANALDPKLAIALVPLPSIASNLLVMWQTGGFMSALRRFWPMYLATLPGLGVGLWLLARTESDGIGAVLGLTLLLFCGWDTFGSAGPQHAVSERERVLALPVGFTTGLVNGTTGSQVMPVLPFLLSLPLDRREFVQAINISFTFSSLIMLAGLVRIGVADSKLLAVAAASTAPVLAGVWLGGRIRERLPEVVFRRAVRAVLVVLGLALVVDACS